MSLLAGSAVRGERKPVFSRTALFGWLSACFSSDRERWKLWCPVLFGAGAGVYLGLEFEPDIRITGAVLLLALLGCVFSRGRLSLFLVFLAVAIFTAGLGTAQFRSALVAAPVIAKKTPPLAVSGRVIRAEPKDGSYRLWLDNLSIGRIAADRTPEKIRIRAHIGPDAVPVPGQRIAIRAVLYPPAGPAAPGAFDFARKSWFERIGGVGYAVSAPEPVAGNGDGTDIQTGIAALRHEITVRIQQSLPGLTGAFAAALLTSERGAIPEETLDAMRDAGLAHLLAISGLHLGLVGGLLFFATRLILSLVPAIALRYPIKKWAAILALCGSFFYLLISGGTLPTQRAFLMIGLVFLAVLFDRNPISMNLVAWAAMAILLIAPESVGNVSFQMSFAAVVALVAAYESVTARRITRGLGPGLARRGSAYVGGVILTTVIAGTATAPFALFHFNQTALYGVLANALAVPLTAFWVMPAGILSLLLMSVGMEELALGVMGGGIGMVVAVARWVSSLPGAVLHLAAIPVWPLAVVVLGGLWLAIWKSGWRILGIVPIIHGAVLAVTTIDPPDILVSETGKKIALRASTGELVFIGSPKGFVGESWARRNGQSLDRLLTIKNKKIAQLIDIECDRLRCLYKNPKGLTVAIIRDHAALSEDCRVADVVISAIPARRRDCSTPSRIIDRFALWRYGPHEIRFREGEARTRSVYDVIGDRPWNRLPGSRR